MFGIFNNLFGLTRNAAPPPAFDDDDDDYLTDDGPSVNIDGSPMVGGVDINGNPFGVTSDNSWSSTDTGFSDSSGGFD